MVLEVPLFRLEESGDDKGKLPAKRTSTQSKTNNQSLTSCTGMQKGYLTGKRNCRNSYMKTMLRSVAFRKHTCKMVNLLKSEDTKFSGVIQKERKNRGVITLVRNNINARETKQYMEEAEYLEVKVTIR